MIYNIIFVGAGVSNLTAANMLLDYGEKDFLLLEKGKNNEDRFCDGEQDKKCMKCIDGCEVIEGVGGANALNGNKICYFPSSSGILDMDCFDEGEHVISYLDQLGEPMIDKSLSNSKAYSFRLNKKYYNSDALDTKQFGYLINLLSRRLKDKIVIDSDVIEIINENNFVKVLTNKGKKYYAKKVVLAMGRSSYGRIEKILNGCLIEYSQLSQDIGIRIEAKKSYFSEKYYYQLDPKFKYIYPGLGAGRTFCAHNSGKVVPARIGEAVYADGAFGDVYTDKNNIALMVRADNAIKKEPFELWLQKIGSRNCGNVFLGERKNFGNSEELVKNLVESMGEYPTEQYRLLMEFFLRDLFVRDDSIIKKDALSSLSLNIYGPAIDRYWLVPKINSDYSLENHGNIFVLGDLAGKSRGFFQAMYSGASWARKYLTGRLLITSRSFTKKEDYVSKNSSQTTRIPY